MRPAAATATLAFLLTATWAHAADFSDPTWPCIQRKVTEISVGQMFPYEIPPLPEEAQETRKAIDALATPLAARRFDLPEVEGWIASFSTRHADNASLGALYQAAFDAIQRQRTVIMAGIARYATKQSALTRRINDARAELAALGSADAMDFDRMDALEEQLDWDERIYRDRARALTYVCESPVLLEKRAFELAQIVRTHWRD